MEAFKILEHRDCVSQENFPLRISGVLWQLEPYLEVRYFQFLGRDSWPAAKKQQLSKHTPLFLPPFLTFSKMLLLTLAKTEYSIWESTARYGKSHNACKS